MSETTITAKDTTIANNGYDGVSSQTISLVNTTLTVRPHGPLATLA